jgi:hypothetical protein
LQSPERGSGENGFALRIARHAESDLVTYLTVRVWQTDQATHLIVFVDMLRVAYPLMARTHMEDSRNSSVPNMRLLTRNLAVATSNLLVYTFTSNRPLVLRISCQKQQHHPQTSQCAFPHVYPLTLHTAPSSVDRKLIACSLHLEPSKAHQN